MISSLSRFDNITAAGILARAAIYLEDKDNPAAANKFPHESSIRESILNDIRKTLGISPDDMSNEALDKVGDALDNECDVLLGEANDHETLLRLSNKGELPSDLYEINIALNINDFFGKKYDVEKKLIEKTIRLPDNEQHYGPPENPGDPFLISLFAKHFPNKYPNNSFTMLVAGERNGTLLTIHQAWRIYKDSICLEGNTDLVDMLRRFAEKFGSEIIFNGKKGHFFLTGDVPNNSPLKYEIVLIDSEHKPKKKRAEVVSTHFIQNRPSGSSQQAALIIAIDLIKYKRLLKSHGW